MFNKLVKPIILYCSGEWGFYKKYAMSGKNTITNLQIVTQVEIIHIKLI